MEGKDVVVVGSCMIDFISYAPRLPNPGETIHGDKLVTGFGGKGANQCVAAAKLGAKTSLIARVGDDIWGEKYIDNLKSQGVNTENVIITPLKTSGIAQIIVAESGQNQIVIVSGANSDLNEDDIRYARNIIANAAVVICQLETSEQVAIKAMEICKGISIMNGAPGLSKFSPDILKIPTIFCVNETEATAFSGITVKDVSDAEVAAKELINKGCNSVIITLGENGALYLSRENSSAVHVPSPSVKCVDTTGAGDAFIGALAYVLANVNNVDIIKAIEIACNVAAESTTRHGTQRSYPDGQILKKFI